MGEEAREIVLFLGVVYSIGRKGSSEVLLSVLKADTKNSMHHRNGKVISYLGRGSAHIFTIDLMNQGEVILNSMQPKGIEV